MSKEKGITLLALQKSIKENITSSFPHQYWIMCEVSSIKANATGHCFLDLIDKDEKAESITAKAQAVIWSSTWKILRPYFESSTGSQLAAGMNILIKAQVQYSELYGLNLIIFDIDPTFTVGELELRKIQIIEKLKNEGMFDMNSSLPLPRLPKKFAVITSETAAGYRDFMKHLGKSENGYSFTTQLFPAIMQGSTAPESIIQALDEVAKEDFDAALILRGGGSTTDLFCFDDYNLSVNIAQFPIPVFTAIGHDQDYHICDMVAFMSLKTPTALADFIVGIYASEEAFIASISTRLKIAIINKSRDASAYLDFSLHKIISSAKERLLSQQNRISILEQRALSSNPLATMKKGGAYIVKDGKRISSSQELSKGDEVEAFMSDGVLVCKIEKIKRYGK